MQKTSASRVVDEGLRSLKVDQMVTVNTQQNISKSSSTIGLIAANTSLIAIGIRKKAT
ncbi:MAG TPA: hypothetical protein VLB68_27980 [Pyrinomonadaceae bacterium]|nr:hypothetical protein [Pyrinomonadaceae bacterium]